MELENIIRTGFVSSVENKAQRLVRVYFPEYSSQVSKPLKVVTVPEDWLPSPGQAVLCLFLPHGDGDGFIIGSL